MTTRRVNPNSGYGWTSTQDGSAGNEYQGTWGFQCALDACAAGDTVLVVGQDYAGLSTSKMDSRYLLDFTTATDKSATWVAGDVVRNDTGDGDNWTGKIIKITTATHVYVALDSGTYADVDIADGVENVTREDAITVSAKTSLAVTYSAGGAGTNIAYIKIQPCDSFYVYDNTKYYYLRGTTGQDGLAISKAFIWIENMVIQYAANRGFYANASPAKFIGCVCLNCGESFYSTASAAYTDHYRCKSYDSTGTAFRMYYRARMIECVAGNCGGHGVLTAYDINSIINCLIYNTTDHAIYFYADRYTTLVQGCIIDKTASGKHGIYMNDGYSDGNLIQNNRISNCGGYAIKSAAYRSGNLSRNNVFDNNTSGTVSNVDDIGSQTVTDTNQGYADANYATSRDYRLLETATGRRDLTKFDPDLTLSKNNFYLTTGLPPDDKSVPTGWFLTI